jgi:hypothetical protein
MKILLIRSPFFCLFTSFGSLFKNFYIPKQYDFFIAELQNLVRWERVWRFFSESNNLLFVIDASVLWIVKFVFRTCCLPWLRQEQQGMVRFIFPNSILSRTLVLLYNKGKEDSVLNSYSSRNSMFRVKGLSI